VDAPSSSERELMFTRAHLVGRYPSRASSVVSRAVTIRSADRRALAGFAVSEWRRDDVRRQHSDAGRPLCPDIEDDESSRSVALRAAEALFDVNLAHLDARVLGRSQQQVSLGEGGFSPPTIKSVSVEVRSRHEGVVIDHGDMLLSFDREGLTWANGLPAVCAVREPELVEIGTADEAVDRALRLLSAHHDLQGREAVRFEPTTVGPRYLALDIEGRRVTDVSAGTVLRAGWRLEFATDFAQIVVRFEVDGDHRVEVGFLDCR
jgi:hypothetical protein